MSQHRKHKWRDHLRPAFLQRTFPPRVIADLDRLSVQVDKADLNALLAGRGLFLHGGVGSGKTLYAAAVMVETARHSYVVQEVPPPSAALVPVTRLLRDLRESMGTGKGEAEVINRYARGIDLLAIDDLGTEKLTDWSFQVLQEIINDRYEQRKPLIVTTNATGLDGLAEYLGDARIPSRLGAMCVQRDFGDQDRREVIDGIS